MDQQRECNEYEEIRELLKEVLRAQEQILRRLDQLEGQLRKDKG